MGKNRLLIIELLAVSLIVLSVVIGIVFDIRARTGNSSWIIQDLRDFSMAVLQIQAGVSTLAVAILALISGMSGHEVYCCSAN